MRRQTRLCMKLTIRIRLMRQDWPSTSHPPPPSTRPTLWATSAQRITQSSSWLRTHSGTSTSPSHRKRKKGPQQRRARWAWRVIRPDSRRVSGPDLVVFANGGKAADEQSFPHKSCPNFGVVAGVSQSWQIGGQNASRQQTG